MWGVRPNCPLRNFTISLKVLTFLSSDVSFKCSEKDRIPRASKGPSKRIDLRLIGRNWQENKRSAIILAC